MHRRVCVCVHLCVYTCTDTCMVCFGSWDKGESSINGFIFFCLSDSLSSLPLLFLFGAFATCPSHPGHQERCFHYCNHKGHRLPSHPSSCGAFPQRCYTQQLLCQFPATASARSLGRDPLPMCHRRQSSTPSISPAPVLLLALKSRA